MCYNNFIMAKRRRSVYRRPSAGEPISWLPIDSRIVPHLFSFGHVKGIARLFLQIEMALSVGVVLGTLAVVVLSILQ